MTILGMTCGMIQELTAILRVHRTVVNRAEDKQMATWFIIQVFIVSASFLVTGVAHKLTTRLQCGGTQTQDSPGCLRHWPMEMALLVIASGGFRGGRPPLPPNFHQLTSFVIITI